MRLLIKNGTIVTASDIYKGDIFIENEIIKEIGLNINKTADEVIDANENQELCIKLGIKGAPTLLVPTNGHYVAYSNASEIKGFAENLVK